MFLLAPERILRRIVELHRIHLFNVLTQHKSIFLSDSQESKTKDDELSGTSALSCWLKLKVKKSKLNCDHTLSALVQHTWTCLPCFPLSLVLI